MHYFVHADKGTTDSSTDQGRKPQLLEDCLIWDVAQLLYKLQRKFSSAWQSRERMGRVLVLHIQDAGE